MQYILSILIPTKNRVEYLELCVQQVLSACSERVQVVVQDNSNEEWLGSNRFTEKYPNFYYYHKKGDISFVENFSLAIENAKGEYFCFIGDDDGILPEIEQLAKWMKENEIDAVSQNISATYFWPNTIGAIPDTETGLLKLYYVNNKVERKKTSLELKKLLYTAGQNYLSRALVKPYHGLVRTKLIEKLKEVTGVYIGGLSPDIYISVALSCFIKYVFVINFPITISGIGAKSGSAASASGSHTGRLSDAPHFLGHKNYVWDKLVPEIYSVETIWADSALHAYRSCSNMNVDRYFCKEYLLKICCDKYFQFSSEIQNFIRRHKIVKFKYIESFLKVGCLDLFYRVIKKITRRKNDYLRYKGVENIIEAEQKIRLYLENNSINFSDTLKQIKK